MMHSYEAEVGRDGTVRLREPLALRARHRAVVTVLEPFEADTEEPGNSAGVLRFLRENRLRKESRPSAEEIDARIAQEREAWD